MPRKNSGTYIGNRPMKRILRLVDAMTKGCEHDEGCKEAIKILLTNKFARSRVRP